MRHPPATNPNSRALAALALVAALSLSARASAQQDAHTVAPRVVRAISRSAPIRLDGHLDDAAWRSAVPARGLTQNTPDEGRAATQETEVSFAYDDAALYIGARMQDRGTVTSRLVRRDQIREGDTDFITLTFDTFHDHLGRATFTVNPAGVKQDALATGGAGGDATWDPVWEASTSIDSAGWTAEIRIPFNQLRFSKEKSQVWGVQVTRFVNRLNERSTLAFWRANEGGGPSRYAHLEGLEIVARPHRAELMPYAVGRSSHILPADPANPFTRKRTGAFRAGADLKYLLTSNLALDATINPDFGQVEVDPAVVNLSAFEVFFPEKRPFFIEGAGLFSFGSFNCFFCSDVSALDLFYSRRIGRSPQGVAAGTYSRIPENSTILGAAKITGRTKGGYSLALLDAVTRAERADVLTIAPDGSRSRFETEVEPLTNYTVGRVKKDFRQGNTVLGAMVTSTFRSTDSDAIAARLSHRAEAVGTDWNVTWREKTYSWVGAAAVSTVGGEAPAILRLQQSSARYFQRPDRSASDGLFSDRLDSTSTSLVGHAGYTRVAKDAGDWLWETGLNYRSPGFEVNDISFQTKADNIWTNFNVGRQFTKVNRWTRFIVGGFGSQRQFNFDGDVTDKQMQLISQTTLPNFWGVNANIVRRPEAIDDRLTRGGPSVRRTGDLTFNLTVNTDRRKQISLTGSPQLRLFENGMRGLSLNADATVKPASNILFSLGPRYQRAPNPHQFVRLTAGRYVFAELVQRTWSMNTRLNVTMSPAMSVEVFAQPFISAADYGRYFEFAGPRQSARSYANTVASSGTGSARVDSLALAGGTRVTIANPDFNLRSLRGNAIFRWEYRPGSTMYLVWQQNRLDRESYGDFEFGRDSGAIFGAHPDNIFLLKLSYWLGR